MGHTWGVTADPLSGKEVEPCSSSKPTMCTASLPCEVRCLACSWKAFNPVPKPRIGKWCFEQLARRGNRTLPLPKSTYALHLSSRLTLQYHNVQEGTLCHRLYSSSCVLCD